MLKHTNFFSFLLIVPPQYLGNVVAQLVEAPRYKPEGRRFDS